MAYLVDGSGGKVSGATVPVPTFDNSLRSSSGPQQGGNGFYSAYGKRLFDIVVASLMLVALAPLLLAVMLAVALDGGKPIFAHTRIGRNGRPFGCLKIRSMRHDAEVQLAVILAADPVAAAEWATDCKLTNDPRVTRIGGFLRRSSLDELPQLVNVLRGEMSLVGPRPVIAEELKRYGPAAASYMAMKPGLTGPWQVDGRNDISYDGRIALDVGYAREHGFRRDLDIVLRTGFSVLKLTGK